MAHHLLQQQTADPRRGLRWRTLELGLHRRRKRLWRLDSSPSAIMGIVQGFFDLQTPKKRRKSAGNPPRFLFPGLSAQSHVQHSIGSLAARARGRLQTLLLPTVLLRQIVSRGAELATSSSRKVHPILMQYLISTQLRISDYGRFAWISVTPLIAGTR
jgi:hypothetical protein